MMIKAYALFDKKVGSYSVPFFFVNDQAALRAAGELAADTGTQMGRHPADFDLCGLGYFDDATGQLMPGPVETLCTLVNLVNNSVNLKQGSLV